MWLPMVLCFFPMAAKLIGLTLDVQFFEKIHFLDEVIVFGHLPCKELAICLRYRGIKGKFFLFTANDS